jgi:quercetin dioxygenase-like cupin family protein
LNETVSDYRPDDWDSSAAAMLALALDPIGPPSSLRQRLLDQMKPKKSRLFPGFREEQPGFVVLRKGEGAWRQTPYPGVDYMTLAVDRQTTLMTTLLRLAPGATYPPHHHTLGEQCLVLEGDVRHQGQDLEMQAGDFVQALPGTDHVTITSDHGCVLLLVSSTADYPL